MTLLSVIAGTDATSCPSTAAAATTTAGSAKQEEEQGKAEKMKCRHVSLSGFMSNLGSWAKKTRTAYSGSNLNSGPCRAGKGANSGMPYMYVYSCYRFKGRGKLSVEGKISFDGTIQSTCKDRFQSCHKRCAEYRLIGAICHLQASSDLSKTTRMTLTMKCALALVARVQN